MNEKTDCKAVDLKPHEYKRSDDKWWQGPPTKEDQFWTRLLWIPAAVLIVWLTR
jgi:hypothetical protein